MADVVDGPQQWPRATLPTPRSRPLPVGWVGIVAMLAVFLGSTVGSFWMLVGFTMSYANPPSDRGVQVAWWLQLATQVGSVVLIVCAYRARSTRRWWLRSKATLLMVTAGSLAVPFLISGWVAWGVS